uniref:Uncharacterized protein n=1 Tax=viral metagenome TaxID=1070528 RepID=A0A6C0BD64_9ZZZZ
MSNLSPQDLIDQVITGNINLDELEPEEIIKMRQMLNPYAKGIKLDNPGEKYYAYSLINLREDYMESFLMTSLIGYLFKRNDEWGVPDGELVEPADDFDSDKITTDFINENLVRGKVVLKREDRDAVSGAATEIEESATNRFKRMVVREFLIDAFKYNPDRHVRSAYKRNKEDTERLKVNPNKKPPPYVRDSTSDHDATREVPPKTKPEERALQEYNRVVSKVPPVDLFYNFRNYKSHNYEALRIATRDLYCLKPEFDYTLIIYDQFDNSKDCTDFMRKHEKDMVVGMKSILRNSWTFQTDVMKNREAIKYSGATSILQEMLDNAESSQKLAQDMLNKRRDIKKKKNREECGEDDDIIKKYNKDKQRERKKAGIKEAKSDMERASRKIGEKFISRNDLPNPALDDDENADVIEVPVWNNTGKTLEPSSFYTKSETPDLPDM